MVLAEYKAVKFIKLFEKYLEEVKALERFKSNIENLRPEKYKNWRNRQIRVMIEVSGNPGIEEFLPLRGFRFRESPEGVNYWSTINSGWLDYIRKR